MRHIIGELSDLTTALLARISDKPRVLHCIKILSILAIC